MRKALIGVFRLAVLVTALVTLPHYVSDTLKASGACQTFTVSPDDPCPGCCTIPSNWIPGDPYSTGPGVQSLNYPPWSCGTARPGGCSGACSGNAYVPYTDPSCCIAEGGKCSVTSQCCGNVCTNGVCTAPPSGGGGGGTPPPTGGPGGNCPTVTGGLSPDCTSGSPIMLDVDGKGYFLTSAANGVMFDISGTGNPIQMGWTAKGADNAFLALPAADGLVHNGKELFGNFTPQPPSDTPNGFAALAVYDLPANGGNGDGVIDSRDAIWTSLRLWIDANHDGICEKDELYTLDELGVNSISLKYRETPMIDQYGNVFRYKAAVNPDDPDESKVGRTAYDVFFVTLGAPPKTPDGWDVRGKLR